MKLSIIIPNYNDAKYISKCLESLINQKFETTDFEIIIVNDGSTDNSLEVLQNFTSEHSKYNIKIIDKKNEGVSIARNTAMKIAKGKYIYFVDSDDYIANDTLHILIDKLEKNDLEVIVFDIIVTSNYNKTESKNIEQINPTLKITNGLEYIANNMYHNSVCSFIVNRSFLKKFNLTFIKHLTLEDCVFTPELLVKAQRMAYLNIDVYRYLQLNTNSIMRNNNLNNLHKNINSHILVMGELNKLIDSLDMNNKTEKKVINRLKNRQQTLLFFLISKLVKAKYPIEKLKIAIDNFKELGVYPLDNFISEKYNGVKYMLLSKVFSNQLLLIFFTRFYKLIK